MRNIAMLRTVSTNTHPYTLLAQKKYTVSLRFPVCAIWSAQIHIPIPFWLKKIHSVTKVPSVRNIAMLRTVSTNTHPYTLLAQKKYTVSLRFPVCAILQCCARSAQIHIPIPFWLKKKYTVSLRFPVCAIWSAQIHIPIPFWLKKNTQCH